MKCPECAQILTGDTCGCGWAMFPHKATEPRIKSHAAYIASGERSDSATVNKYLGKIKKGDGGGRRNCFLPGESFDDYKIALHAAQQKGIKKYDFDMARMKTRGWSEELERAYRENCRKLGIQLPD